MTGAGTAGVLRSVLAPLLAPSMLYAWIWIALLTYRELTLPVVLSSSSNLPFRMPGRKGGFLAEKDRLSSGRTEPVTQSPAGSV